MEMVEKIKEIAESKGITIKDLEEKCGFPKTTISRWHDRMPSADKLAKVSTILGVSSQVLLGMEEPKEEKTKEEIIEEIFHREELRVLFSMAENAPKEDIEYVIKKLEKLRGM